jgi:hypothetical protein
VIRVALLTGVLYATWLVSRLVLPAGAFHELASGLVRVRLGAVSMPTIVAANLLPFLGLQLMNLFDVRGRRGGVYLLVWFWVLYGILLGTNSFAVAGPPVPMGIDVIWSRSGFTELVAYAFADEASRKWRRWRQTGLFAAQRVPVPGRPAGGDAAFEVAGVVLLLLAAWHEAT